MVEDVRDKSLIDRLREGEKIQCLECGKGHYVTSANDISISHGFACSVCNSMVNIDPVIDIE